MATAGEIVVGALVVGVLGVVAYEMLSPASASSQLPSDANARGTSGEWWVQLYNYEKGNPDRRQKGLDGPYPTRGEAEAQAAKEKDVWYVKVVRSKTQPWDTEKRQARRRRAKRRTKRSR